VPAGERWTSCPQSVHPALADVAFLVNDQMTDDGRRLLTPLAPWLLGTNTTDPQTWPAITEVCVRAALTWVGQPDEPWLQVDLNAARNWPAGASRPANRRRIPGQSDASGDGHGTRRRLSRRTERRNPRPRTGSGR
jgi:hypothetical protein